MHHCCAVHHLNVIMSSSNIFPTSSKLDFISTKRGGTKLLYDGHRFHRKKIYVNGDSFWKCCNETICKGNLTLNQRNEIKKINEHDANCTASHAKNIVLKEFDQLKQISSCNFQSIQQQYDEVVKQINDSGIQLLEEVPKYSSVKTGLYNERNKILGAPKVRFVNPSDVVVPAKYTEFLLADYDDDSQRIIVFCSKENREQIRKYHHFFADGTFKSCPKGFKQLYTIHGYNEQNKCVTPLLFCLMCDKKMKSYEILFNLIKTTLSTWVPKKITMDFELAAIHAIRRVFPTIVFRGCYYHFNRCLWRKAKALNINTRPKKRHVARCIGLARLPQNFINTGYRYVMARSPVCIEINKFNAYFKKQWVSKDKIEKECCCHDEAIRTNNNIEGWHAKINKYVGRKNPTLAHLLHVLETESTSFDLRKVSKKKNKEYEEIDKEITSAIEELKSGIISVGHCIEIICPYVIW